MRTGKEEGRERERGECEDLQDRNGEDGTAGRAEEEEEDCELSSHINKREDTVCEAAEKPPSLQPPAEIAGFERTLETY